MKNIDSNENSILATKPYRLGWKKIGEFRRDQIEPFEANGYHFKQGDTLVVHINTLHRQPNFYPEPDRFNPDHFAPEQEQPEQFMTKFPLLICVHPYPCPNFLTGLNSYGGI